MSFAELAAAAGVGTRRVAPARATDLALEGTERTALLELGALGLMRRAGATGVAATPLPPAPEETRRVADVADALEEALDESMAAAQEWAREAARRGFVAPPAAVSRLVPLAARHPEFRAVLGERGRWLAGVMGVAVEAEASPLADPAEWETLDPKARSRLVAEGPEDADLFARALGDRRKEIREAAAERLVRMPDSPQARELRQRALGAVRIERGFLRTRLAVDLPEADSLPGWLPRSASRHGVGGRALALMDLLAHVPPSAWGAPPADLLGWAEATEDAPALREGWRDAALRFGDPKWIDTLVLLPPKRFPGGTEALFPLASEAAFERAALAWLRPGERGFSAVVSDLAARKGPLSPAVSRALLAAVLSAVQGEKASYLGYELPSFGTVLDLSVLPSVEAMEDERLAAVRDAWRKLLDLRRRLLESLS